MSSALSASSPQQPKASERADAGKQPHAVSRSTVTALNPGWTDVATLADLDELGSSVVGKLPGSTVLLVRTSLGISAVAGRCSYCGGVLNAGTIDGDSVICPQHRGVFDLLDGAVLAGPPTQPLAIFEVRELAGRLQVRRSRD